MKIEDYCETKKYDCSDCEINKNHESGNCEKLFDAYTLGYSKAIDDFENACKEDILCQTFGLHINGIERIAEQLKVGGKE